MEASVITLIIVGVMLVLYMTELLPIAVTSILACLACSIFGVIPFNKAFEGFGNDLLFLLTGMLVVGAALFETGVAQVIGKKIISMVGTNKRIFIVASIFVSTLISLFISNTATAALVLPITASAIAASDGKLNKKDTFMMMGIVVCAGGGLTLIGSTPQLIAQGLLQEGGYETVGFFEYSLIGLPVLILITVFYLTVGIALQRKVFDFPEIADNTQAADDTNNGPGGGKAIRSGNDLVGSKTIRSDNGPDGSLATGTASKIASNAEILPTASPVRMLVSVGILLFCIIGFVTDLWSMGVVAMVGAVLCVATKSIPHKKALEKMDWTTVIIVGCSFGISNALDRSGAGRLVARGMINLLGDSASPWLLCSVLTLISALLTNFMSSTATASLLIPIGALMATELNYDVKGVVMAVAIAANIGYATPISTPPITMTLSGGYRFKDYVKVGGLLNLLAIILVIALLPLILNK